MAAMALGMALMAPAAAVHADETTSQSGAARVASIGFDAVILRPVGFVALVVGAGLFVPAALITAPNGWHSITEAREILVDNPAEHLFQRPLGDF